MDLTYKLTTDDLADCAEVISILEQHHKTNLMQLIIGIMGEYAAIKFINDQLWKTEKLQLNTNYVNGFDGGHDFMIGKDKWDVKTFGMSSAFDFRNASTQSDILLFTKHLGDFKFKMLGFMPASDLADYQESRLLPISKIPQVYPDLFTENPYDLRLKPKKDPKVSKTLMGILTKMRLNYV